MEEDSLHISLNQAVGDSLDISHYKGEVYFAIDEPWAGDTETGFGRQTSFCLKAEEARYLANWILQRVK